MKAISQRVLGGPEVLEIVEVDTPQPGPGEVLVRVAATSVNAADWKLRAGVVDRLGPPPFTLGLDVSGTVAAVGQGTTDFRPGDEVFGMVRSRSGAYAEYVVVPADSLAGKLDFLDHVHAAALPTAGLTAWQALRELQPGQRVLVHAAAGGVGHLAVQIAKARGTFVIGTARSANHGFLRELGADEVIDYTTTDFTTAATEIDVVLDLVGGEYGPRSLTILRPDGRLIDTQRDDPLDDPRFYRHFVAASGSDLAELTDLIAHGKLRVEVAQVMPLADAARAHQLSESGRVRGKLVLTP